MNSDLPPEAAPLEPFVYCGYGISGMAAGAVLACGYFRKQSRGFLITALWPITMGCVLAVGEAMLIPYAIYNMVMISKENKKTGLYPEVHPNC